MDASEFTHCLEDLSRAEFDQIAQDLRTDCASADGEVGWWRATVAIGCALRRRRRTREAGLAAHQASATVLQRAEGLSLLATEHDQVTLVARAAADVARGLVAGGEVADHLSRLLHPWRTVLGPALSAA